MNTENSLLDKASAALAIDPNISLRQLAAKLKTNAANIAELRNAKLITLKKPTYNWMKSAPLDMRK